MLLPAYPNKQLHHALQELEVIDAEQLDKLFQQAEQTQTPLDQILVEKNLISDPNIGKLIADLLELPFINLREVKIEPETIRLLPENVSKTHHLVIFKQTEEELKVATSNPFQENTLQFVAQKYATPVRLYYATERDIENAWKVYRQDLTDKISKLTDTDEPLFATEHSTSDIVNMLLEHAYISRASDIHIEPGPPDPIVRYRIDGILTDIVKLPKKTHEQIISRLKVLSRLRTDEHFTPQDGKLHVQINAEDLDIRVSIVPVIVGEKAVLRILSSSIKNFSLNDLGMSDADLKSVTNGFKQNFGMILSTGPTGSGKTTTIYSILKIINSRDVNIATIEDPDEYKIAGINQMVVNKATGFTFATGLRSILRQDPDIIFVGEIRDSETAQIATNAALTGHLVFSTLHTNDAATAIPRLSDMGVEPFLISSTVNVIVAQRLVRKICESCRYSQTLPLEHLTQHFPTNLVTKYFGKRKQIQLYEGKGCPVCRQSGLSGRVGIFEVLTVDETIRQLIMDNANAELITKQAIKNGMTTMLEDGILKISLGVTTLEEVLRCIKR